ncbi:thioredoxin [Cerasicoccus maritimus]|uniref:thioredoxin n=1 Tax=Cerasicoccus maritimus TaxID=490089 RepID=UPI0028525B00|nr:thioredoxin [Cerasicoccus maritimus]
MKRAILIFCAIIGVVFLATKNRSSGDYTAPENSKVAQGDFEAAVAAKQTVLVDFWAPWCGPCRKMEPVVEQIAEQQEGKVAVYKVNVDDQAGLAQKYGVRSIPTFLVFKNGSLVAQEVGVVPATTLTRHF